MGNYLWSDIRDILNLGYYSITVLVNVQTEALDIQSIQMQMRSNLEYNLKRG